MKINKVLKILAFVSAVVSISGFLAYSYHADVSAIGKSEISISDASFSEIGLTYCKLKLNVEINNPSSRSISDLSVKFDIYLTETYVGNGSFSKISIPSHSSRTRDMTVTIYYAGLGSSLINMLKEGKVTITIKGEVDGSVLYGIMSFSRNFNTSYSIV